MGVQLPSKSADPVCFKQDMLNSNFKLKLKVTVLFKNSDREIRSACFSLFSIENSTDDLSMARRGCLFIFARL